MSALPPEALRRRCDRGALAGVEAAADTVPAAQAEALAGLDLALEIDRPGFHAFVMGATPALRRALSLARARHWAATRAAPADRILLHDFDHPDRPLALALPAGTAHRLATTWQSALRAPDPARLAATIQGLPDGVVQRLQGIAAHAMEFKGAADDARFGICVLVANDPAAGAPVVEARAHDVASLFGRIEYRVACGGRQTDHTRVRAGAVQHALGGCLILDAERLLAEEGAWEHLKQALSDGRVRIPGPAPECGVWPESIEPEPIGGRFRLVLQGERELYYALLDADPEFASLVGMPVDLADDWPRDAASEREYAALLLRFAGEDGLPPLAPEALASLIEHAARLAEDAERLSADPAPLRRVLHEAGHHAGRTGAARIEAEHVAAALAARRRRGGRIAERYRDAILRQTVRIETEGARIGQVNGLALVELGEARFGHPTRIAATVRYGEGELIDIQREVDLAGSLHAKGVLTLGAFLATRFASSQPLSLSATLTFEQMYGEVEGDSASMAELCALLSAIGDLPVQQGIAVTGSVDLYGNMQAIGGVNEKIEGFFELCAARGLTGEQGVVIPESNVKHLMLAETVVAACAEGRFHVWAVADVDAAIARLTGLPAGEPDENGVVPPGSVNYRVAARLMQYSGLRQAFSGLAPAPRRVRRIRRRKGGRRPTG